MNLDDFHSDFYMQWGRKNITYNLKQSKITSPNVIKVNFHIFPSGLLIVVYELITFSFIVDIADVEHFTRCGINAMVELASKEIHTHNTKDQPKYETNQKHIHNGGNCSNKGINNHLGYILKRGKKGRGEGKKA